MGYDQQIYVKHYLRTNKQKIDSKEMIEKYFVKPDGTKLIISGMPKASCILEDIYYTKGFFTLDKFLTYHREISYPGTCCITYEDLENFSNLCVRALAKKSIKHAKEIFGSILDNSDFEMPECFWRKAKEFVNVFREIPKTYRDETFEYEVY